MGAWWWVLSAVGLEEAAELNDALTAAIDLRGVVESGHLDGLPNGSDCAVHRLRSDLTAASIVSTADPDSKCGSFLK